MKNGKDKCEILKEIRKYVAKKYGLEYDAHTLKDQWSCIRLIKM